MSDFLNDLSTVVSNDLLSDLNFTDNTIDEFNHRISGDNRINDLTVFHMNIRSLNKNKSKLEITCHDGKPDGMLRVERRRYGSAPDVSRGASDRRPDT